MLHSNAQSVQHFQQSRLWNRVERSLTTLVVALGLGVAASQMSYASEVVSPVQFGAANPTVAQAEALPNFENGVYLYGQTAEPDQMGSEYLVFEVRDRQIIGAFYMPYSSFDCFYGSVGAEQLALTIIPTYEQQQTYSYTIALDESATVASNDPSSVVPVGLEGYVPLEQVSENDYRMLEMCQSDVGEL